MGDFSSRAARLSQRTTGRDARRNGALRQRRITRGVEFLVRNEGKSAPRASRTDGGGVRDKEKKRKKKGRKKEAGERRGVLSAGARNRVADRWMVSGILEKSFFVLISLSAKSELRRGCAAVLVPEANFEIVKRIFRVLVFQSAIAINQRSAV